ncbi:hydrogenase maturation protease [Streptomyces sp. WMMB 322]|uniref:hydrogenase maturation protease n=1 Tax=Streptomyces sp. WMMB 322 TaxID=1286821 RepID=UPI0006E13670|nr:hydrogenase maturation protease [Streptomyces sp. WMMB 322]SCK15789.1 hydrogenase maturation protease [Streptomyces sp. WMMB 322]
MNPLRVPARTVVIGIGNVHRRDDGAGPRVVTRLAAGRGVPAGVALHVSDGEPGRLVALWKDAESAIVVDAARARPGQPGTVHRLEAADIGLLPAPEAGTHGLGLGEAVRLARTLGSLPPRLLVYAVETADTGFGTGLTGRVEAAVETLARLIRRQLPGHGGAAAGAPEPGGCGGPAGR